jgi:hypothetical protein
MPGKTDPEPVFVALHKDWGGWQVHVTFADRTVTEIGAFATQDEANAWIKKESAGWFEMHQSARRSRSVHGGSEEQ